MSFHFHISGAVRASSQKERRGGVFGVCRGWRTRFRCFDLRVLGLVGVLLVFGCVCAPDALAAGSDVGQNVGGLLKHYAGEVYGGIVAAFSLVFLWNRRYIELATFLFAAIVVAWMVFAPDQIGRAAEGIGKQIFG
ncbi:MAG: hypothetical protein ACYDHN_03590 [Solirubrobacteraceae bacterium]